MCQVFLWGERGFSSATDNVPSPLAPPARGERRPRLAGVGEGALATELNAALRSGPRRFEVQDFASLIPVEESTAFGIVGALLSVGVCSGSGRRSTNMAIVQQLGKGSGLSRVRKRHLKLARFDRFRRYSKSGRPRTVLPQGASYLRWVLSFLCHSERRG